jgi:DNA-directed RNA polymerase subunit beta
MTKSFTGRKRIRKDFGRIPEIALMPNLIEVQKTSYDHFLQVGVASAQRQSVGLQEVFRSVFPIKDFSDRAELQFVKYELEEPKYDVEECQERGMTFAAPLKVTLRLVVWDIEEDTCARSIRDIKEQDVYMGDMADDGNGTFIVNGTGRSREPDVTARRACFRPRGQDPFLGQVSVRGPRHPLSRPG